jgi:hypothetical protein
MIPERENVHGCEIKDVKHEILLFLKLLAVPGGLPASVWLCWQWPVTALALGLLIGLAGWPGWQERRDPYLHPSVRPAPTTLGKTRAIIAVGFGIPLLALTLAFWGIRELPPGIRAFWQTALFYVVGTIAVWAFLAFASARKTTEEHNKRVAKVASWTQP